MKKFITKISAIILSGIPSVAFAANCGSGGGLQNPLNFCSLSEFLRAVLEVVIQIGYPIIVLFIVYVGFKYVTAQGNADKLKEVHKFFFWAVVGALIVLGAQVLSYAIQGTVQDLGG